MDTCTNLPRVNALQPAIRPPCDTGATAVEYAIMTSLIAGVIVGSVGVFGTAVSNLFVVPWP